MGESPGHNSGTFFKNSTDYGCLRVSPLNLWSFAMQYLVTLINDRGFILEQFQVDDTPTASQILKWKQSRGCVRMVIDIAC